jgi:hypothetical protein
LLQLLLPQPLLLSLLLLLPLLLVHKHCSTDMLVAQRCPAGWRCCKV